MSLLFERFGGAWYPSWYSERRATHLQRGGYGGGGGAADRADGAGAEDVPGVRSSPILAASTEKRGFPPYDPRLMVRLLIYGYTTGVRSSRAIERGCVDDVAFRYLDALAGIFTQSLHLAQRVARPMGMAQANFTDSDSRIMKNSDGAALYPGLQHPGRRGRRTRSSPPPM